MQPTSIVSYSGNLRTEMQHQASGQVIITDAPVDNNGLGQAFSPTDLVASGLAACALTIMGITARREGLDIDHTRVEVVKHMAPNPRRIVRVDVKVHVPNGQLTVAQRQLLEEAAHTCPVAKSLHPDIAQQFEFVYG